MTGKMKCCQQHEQSQENKIIELADVCVEFDGRSVLKDINFSINKNDFIAITGPNGGGKTTLLRILLKLIKPTRGTITYFDNGRQVECLKVGYLPQKNQIDTHFPISVKEVIATGLMGFRNISKTERATSVYQMMERMGVTAAQNEALCNLSGGQMQRVLLGRALISQPEVLVLDEPLSYVDKHFEREIYRIVEEEAKSSTIILVSHEMTAIAPMATRHLIVDHTVHDCHAHHHFIISQCE